MKRLFILILFVILLGNGFAYLQVSEKNELYEKTFQQVWNTVYEQHFDSTFGGLDWKKQKEIYFPRAMDAKTDDEFHNVLSQMLGELKQSHFNVYTKTIEANATKCTRGTTGIRLRILEDQAVVTEIETSSAAELSGLKVGFALIKIDGKTISQILQPFEEIFSKRGLNDRLKTSARENILVQNLCGESQTLLKIEALDKNDTPQLFELIRQANKNNLERVAEGVPPRQLIFETKILENKIGYIKFNLWVETNARKFKESISSMQNLAGLIIDLRSNGGGTGSLAKDLGGTMFRQTVSFGSSSTRYNKNEIIVEPHNKIYEGKVVILTNNGTSSTSEAFTAGMQATKRAKVIGETTAGAVLLGRTEMLPTGAYFMYAVADYRTPNGILIEGRGIEPDVKVNLTRQTLLEGRDLQLETALKLLQERKKL